MPSSTASLERLFDRTWRPGHPFRPRLSPLRRWGTILILCLLLAIIFGYQYLTDSRRVKAMCEAYLSQLTGGKVQIGHAALSIFEGLRLDKVRVQVDDANQADSTLFEVASLSLKYNPESILNGKLEATEIVATDPVVSLCENLDARRWNYQRIVLPIRPATSQPGRKAMVIPQIKLRNGFIHYSQMHNGVVKPLGTMAIDGSVSPGDVANHYLFRVQSRGVRSDLLGPVVTGEFASDTREVKANLANFEFGPDIKAVLPSVVRQWLNDHQLAGRVSIPSLDVIPDRGGKMPTFRVAMEMDGVQLANDPNEWLSRAEQEQVNIMGGAFDLMRFAGLNGQVAEAATTQPQATGFVDALENTIKPSLVRLEGVRGRFVFTQDGIDIESLNGIVAHNQFDISGHIAGYSPGAGAKISISGTGLKIPRVAYVMNSMPRVVRDIYTGLRPEGTCDLQFTVDRSDPSQKPVVEGRVDFREGSITCDQFPYPLRVTGGAIKIEKDPQYGERLKILDVIGVGVFGGPNEHRHVTITGGLAPINGDAEVNVYIKGEDVQIEPAFRNALPHEARDVLKTLDPSGKGDYPTFRGDIFAHVHRDAGPYKPFTVTTTLDMKDMACTYEGFAYPLENITGRLVVGPRYAKLEHLVAHKNDASVQLDGQITWEQNKPVTPNLKLSARKVPIDATLLAAINAGQREWLEKLGVGGKLDVDGTIKHKSASTRPSDVDVVLDMSVHDGTLHPRDSEYVVSNLDGEIHLGEGRTILKNFKGTRGDASLTADGMITWNADHPDVSITASGQNLLLEPALYGLLPKPGKAAWDSVQPRGTVDAVVKYGSAAATTRPTTQPFAVTIHPRKLDVTLKSMPYLLSDVTGQVDVSPDGTVLKEILAHHGSAKLAISGSSLVDEKDKWTLNLMGRDLLVDADLHHALPGGLASLIDAMKLHGSVSFDFPKLTYAPNSPTSLGASAADMSVGGTIWFNNASIDVGMPVTDLTAVMKLDAAVSQGKLAGLRGSLQAPSLKFAGREARNFYCDLFKPAKDDALRLEKVQCWLANGELAGQVDVAFPENAASHYALNLILRNADVPQLTGEKDVKGQLTASLALEGAWNDARSRRGRGDVTVAGKDMYRIPLVLGLLQITNLALPISSPFNEANARYSVEGPKITFESIELRANNMVMQGSGSLNFDSKKVNMTFTTDNPHWPKLPIVGDLLAGAKHELLRIKVNGTVQEPKVSGSVMNTFTTTVDEVLRPGDSEDEDGIRKRHR